MSAAGRPGLHARPSADGCCCASAGWWRGSGGLRWRRSARSAALEAHGCPGACYSEARARYIGCWVEGLGGRRDALLMGNGWVAGRMEMETVDPNELAFGDGTSATVRVGAYRTVAAPRWSWRPKGRMWGSCVLCKPTRSARVEEQQQGKLAVAAALEVRQ